MRKKWRRYNTLNSVTRNGTQQQQTMTTAAGGGGLRRSSRSVTSSTAVYFPRFARHSAYSIQSLFTRLDSIVINCDQTAKNQQQQQPMFNDVFESSTSSSSKKKKKKKRGRMSWICRRRLDAPLAMATIKDCSAEADGTTDPVTDEVPQKTVPRFEEEEKNNSLSISSEDNSNPSPHQQPVVCLNIRYPSTPNDYTFKAG